MRTQHNIIAILNLERQELEVHHTSGENFPVKYRLGSSSLRDQIQDGGQF
jgi:hypothetical protein